MRSFARTLLVLALLGFTVCCAQTLSAQDFSSLQAEVWLDFEPMGADGPLPRPTNEEASRVLLEEARLLFSGMIYGYSFSYVPSDTVRQVGEQFDLKVLATIPWGDSRLEYRQTRADESSVYLRVRYFPSKIEQTRLKNWNSNRIPDYQARGEASYFDGPKSKLKALDQGIKEAVRNLARGIIRNKPAELRGLAVLAGIPRFAVIGGNYVADVRVFIRLEESYKYLTY